MEIRIENTDALASAAQKFVDEMGENRVFAFYGKMGAGKTTFIKAICEALGVEDVVASPTFAIVNEYMTPHPPLGEAMGNERESREFPLKGVRSVFHFDFYRIKNLREAYDIGCEEYFYSGCPCFIEWPEMIEELLPEDTVKVHIEVLDDESRLVKTSAFCD
ncbi:MAG: tRNA (adenosine(37)-N6)-threonylcarbamoyltransferase complex ATPase subunit type 1 TsaE [Bacteroidaceae bacterium]|nr:tRNA (adenosine(37)-N6)-threonylcarbamoyltransferase complex ATPase subunit type 1 TsaE [Bacteroidaceae bacterium]